MTTTRGITSDAPRTPDHVGQDVSVLDVVVDYPTPIGPVRALELESFVLAAGAAVAVMGPSGSGKSTLLGLLAGLATPTRGTVRIGRHGLATMTDAQRSAFRRRNLGMVYQSDNLLPHLTVEENVALSLAVAASGVDSEVRCAQLLDDLGIRDLARRFPSQLSGGQRQRVGVARAVAHRPSLVLADEPTGALDGRAGQTVVEALQSASSSVGATLVVVTHDPSVAAMIGETRLLLARDHERSSP